jgi:hypothetical protein
MFLKDGAIFENKDGAYPSGAPYVAQNYMLCFVLTLKYETSGQCHKTFYGHNYVAIGVTQSKS